VPASIGMARLAKQAPILRARPIIYALYPAAFAEKENIGFFVFLIILFAIAVFCCRRFINLPLLLLLIYPYCRY